MENLTVKVYGSGCKGCQTLIDALAEMNLVANVEYITDLQKVMEAGIMSMPTLSVNEKVVSSGKILGIPEIKKIIEAEQ